jgi:hypothetical protein
MASMTSASTDSNALSNSSDRTLIASGFSSTWSNSRANLTSARSPSSLTAFIIGSLRKVFLNHGIELGYPFCLPFFFFNTVYWALFASVV